MNESWLSPAEFLCLQSCLLQSSKKMTLPIVALVLISVLSGRTEGMFHFLTLLSLMCLSIIILFIQANSFFSSVTQQVIKIKSEILDMNNNKKAILFIWFFSHYNVNNFPITKNIPPIYDTNLNFTFLVLLVSNIKDQLWSGF